ncbi:hypothetical protein COY17_04395 [Candidatus Saccharibacteria bacterium CG_4_10_14_0_2_um_filter_52_9]|nr:MAG: hypothetical protein COY17_04395 [Candidatus Saccharibacteria bacterium CG_4_10_14_0_2_um_filter_52_9]
MTRWLSESLQAPEPFFRLGLRRLESANGNPGTDIRFSSEVLQATRAKLMELGLDPQDTTPTELYHALQERVKADDARLTKNLRTHAATHVSAEGEVVAGMIHVIKQLPDSKRCFALKSSSLKAVLKQVPPKKAMKRLGYRSLDSLLKHEAPLSVLAAAWLNEGGSWQRRLLDQYKKLSPGDFENRSMMILQPDSRRWRELAAAAVDQNKHNLLCFKEVGALVFLPLPREIPKGAVTVSLTLALHELNEIRASSSFLKLSQVKPNFGRAVRTVASDEPRLSSQLLDQPVPWHLIQRYYARLTHQFREEVFEPHLQAEDMTWHSVERTLSAIEPSFKFWHDTAHLAVLHDRKPVSFNLVDTALSACNQLAFEQRVVHHFQKSLWHELLLRYLRHQPVEDTVLAELQPQLVEEAALA